MNWKEQWKGSRLVTVASWFVATIIGVGAVAGAINDIFEFAGQDFFNGADSWLATTYTSLTGWLSVGVILPIWSMLAALALAIPLCFYQHRKRADLAASLISVKAELDELKNPTTYILDTSQEQVLFWATLIYDGNARGEGPTPQDIASISGSSLTIVETALDVLKQKGVVRLKRLRSAPIDLTAEGRAYLAREDVISRFAAFRATPGGGIIEHD
ncbi:MULTISPECIES: hypothetical protein [Pseudomonas]|uniref:hypothetical protein n=1 Tax=Pseudomonas nitroreducens TaxID=46680 RepID=UPI001E3A604F|nr:MULTISPECIES: hypothetical protein [Pseudomonas]MCE4069664.1 hypothetical protein [Pseudomonas nitritireducens]MCE4079173.1 hypothetical protein [Pseudomonas nitroreducens]